MTMIQYESMINKITREESTVKKMFKKDNFEISKLDNHNKYKSPDFLIIKSRFKSLVEVKIGF